MTRKVNPFGRTVDKAQAYATYRVGGWTWKVLKTYQRPDKETGNKYARWFCAVKSPYTYGSWELGDVYKSEIVSNAQLVECSQEWQQAYGVKAEDIPSLRKQIV